MLCVIGAGSSLISLVLIIRLFSLALNLFVCSSGHIIRIYRAILRRNALLCVKFLNAHSTLYYCWTYATNSSAYFTKWSKTQERIHNAVSRVLFSLCLMIHQLSFEWNLWISIALCTLHDTLWSYLSEHVSTFFWLHNPFPSFFDCQGFKFQSHPAAKIETKVEYFTFTLWWRLSYIICIIQHFPVMSNIIASNNQE